MSKNKLRPTTILLIFATVFLIGAIFYLSTLLTSGDENKASQVAPRQTKAASVTYSKLIALNSVAVEPTPTPTEAITSQEYDSQTATENTVVESSTPTPTPTETVLAYVNPTTTNNDASSEADIATSKNPTTVKDLPDAGFIYNGLIIFAAAMVLVFFSFLF